MPPPQRDYLNGRQRDLGAESGHRRRSGARDLGIPRRRSRVRVLRAIEVLLLARRRPTGVYPGHARQRLSAGSPGLNWITSPGIEANVPSLVLELPSLSASVLCSLLAIGVKAG